jgi:hypothetical protein
MPYRDKKVVPVSLCVSCAASNDGSTVAVSQQFSGIELVLSVLKLIFFNNLVLSADIFIPTTQKS